MKPSYQRVLLVMRDGLPRDHDTICAEAVFEGPEDDSICTGAISILRRMRFLEQTPENRKKYVITPKGMAILQSPSKLMVLESRR